MQPLAPGNQHPRLLLIDDQTLVAEMVKHMLADQTDIAFLHVTDANAALPAALSFKPTVILVDVKMPQIDGFGVLSRFRSHPETQRLPMILLSAEDSPESKARGFSEGANDYLVKWPSKLELIARIRYHSIAYIGLKQRDEAFLSLQQSRQDLLDRTRELAESQAALHHVQKMEAVGKLTGGVAHDFNNVLQIISGNLQLMKLELAGNDRAQRRIAAAAEGVTRGAKLAAQLLAFGRRQTLQPSVIDIGALVRDMHDMVRRSIGELTRVTTVVPDDLWYALVDPNQLENVILNLAINARDAMNGEGELTIRTANFTLHATETVDFPGMMLGEYVMIAVTDTGTGMSDEVQSRAFEPFFTTKPAGQGTGLGLSMAYGFVKQSGGHIEIDSRLGAGTTVTLYLPRAEGKATNLPDVAEPEAVSGGLETILVVEDEPDVRTTTVEILSKLGYRTLQAEDAQSALHILQSGLPIDLLFTDVVMPGPIRTEELAARAEELVPGIAVLFASGFVNGGLGSSQGGKLLEDVCLLTKPYSGEDLAQKVRQVLQKKKPARAAAGMSGLKPLIVLP